MFDWLKQLLASPVEVEPKKPLWVSKLYQLKSSSNNIYMSCWVQTTDRVYYQLYIGLHKYSPVKIILDAKAILPLIEMLERLKEQIAKDGSDLSSVGSSIIEQDVGDTDDKKNG